MSTEQEAGLAEIIRRHVTAETYERLAELAKPHIAANPLFESLPFNSADQAHDLAVVSLDPEPSNLEEVKGLLDVAYPSWREVIVPKLAQRTDLVNELQNRIVIDQTPFSLLLAHERIEDVAFVAAAFVVLMSERIGFEELVGRMHIVVSSIIRTMGAFGVSAASVLQKIGHVHFSFPRTESMRRSGFDEQLVTASNKLVRLQIARAPKRVLAVAGPGSVDKVVGMSVGWVKRVVPDSYKERHTTSHIQPVNHGTAKLLEGYTLPVASVLSGPKQFCTFGRLEWVSNLEDVHRQMEWIADERHRETLVPTYYHREPSKLPIGRRS